MYQNEFLKHATVFFYLALTVSCSTLANEPDSSSSDHKQIIDIVKGDFLNDCATPNKLDIRNNKSINALQGLKFDNILQPYYYDKDFGYLKKKHPVFKYTFNNRIYTNRTERVRIQGTKIPFTKITFTDTISGERGILEPPEEIGFISTIKDSVQLGDTIYFLANYKPDKDSFDFPMALWSFDLPTEQLNIHVDGNFTFRFVSEKLHKISGKIYLQAWNNNSHFLYTLNTSSNIWEGVDLGRARSTEIGIHFHEIIFHKDKFYSVGVLPDSYPAILRLLEFDPATGLTKDLTPLPENTNVSGVASYIKSASSSIVWVDQKYTMYQYDTNTGQLKEIRQKAAKNLSPVPAISTDNFMIYYSGFEVMPDKRSRKNNRLYALNLTNHQIQELTLSDSFVDEMAASTNLSPTFVTDDLVLLTTKSLSPDKELWTIDLSCTDPD